MAANRLHSSFMVNLMIWVCIFDNNQLWSLQKFYILLIRKTLMTINFMDGINAYCFPLWFSSDTILAVNQVFRNFSKIEMINIIF